MIIEFDVQDVKINLLLIGYDGVAVGAGVGPGVGSGNCVAVGVGVKQVVHPDV